jgi:hypothetical protein
MTEALGSVGVPARPSSSARRSFAWGRLFARRHGTWGWHLSSMPLVESITALDQVLSQPTGEESPQRPFDLGVANTWTALGQSVAFFLYALSFLRFAGELRVREAPADMDARAWRPPNRP